jgi:hypothetical protein
MSSQFATPVMITREEKVTTLERLPLGGEGAKKYNEDWLQKILFEQPSTLPINEIDPSFQNLVPVCRELNTPAGPIDVLYATPEGKLVILEAKLWRNPEARRKVIGQILDYAKELGRWTYEDLQREVAKATRIESGSPQDLYQIVSAQYPETLEAQFIDAVARNLKRGEFLLLIVGDGIHEGVAAIADFLENHGTLHFTFGMVEMAIYRVDKDSLMIQPRVLAQTVIVKRTVISLESPEIVAREASEIEEEESGELSDNQKFYKEFWTELIGSLNLDYKTQRLPNVTITNYIYIQMPPSNGSWLKACLMQKNKVVEVSLTFSKGQTGDIIYKHLLEQREQIDAEIAMPITWQSADGKHEVRVSTHFPDLKAPEYREAIKTWLSDQINRFVNAFRPRIERIVEDVL